MPRCHAPLAHTPARPGAARAGSWAWAGLLSAWLCSPAQADPGYYLVQPYDNAGLTTVESRYWTVARKDRASVAWPELGLSHGINSRWTSGVFWSWIGPLHGPFTLSTFNWSNQWMLTQGNWPLDVAAHTQWIHDHNDRGGGRLEFGPLLQTDLGRSHLSLNLLFERGLGNNDAQPTQLKLQWQLRHRWQPGLHWGLQGFSELGPWDQWAAHGRQSHRAGPAVFGQLGLGGHESLALSAAWLQGRTYGHSGHMLSLRAAVSF